MTDETDDLKQQLRTEHKPKRIDWAKGLSTGSTLLNLACTGRPNVGLLPGHFHWVIGDSDSGKSITAMTCFAEAARNKVYNKHRLIYDNAEDGVLMDIAKFFGKEVEKRLEPPRHQEGVPCYSSTVEEFYFHLDDAFDLKRPFVYILDSMDALDSEKDDDQFQKEKKASRAKTKKEVTGSYGTAKAKANSNGLRRACSKLHRTDSILVIVSQTRDTIGFGAQFNPKTVSGGRALKFYSDVAFWTSTREAITKKVGKKERNVGIKASIKFAKNRFTGQKHRVEVPIYWSFGLDDVGSMVDWLIDEEFWTKQGHTVVADELKIKGTKEGLIAQIEEQGKENDLKLVVAEAWQGIVDACQMNRKKRYD